MQGCLQAQRPSRGLSDRLTEKSRQKRKTASYNPQLCHDELRRKKISTIISPHKGAGYWPVEYADHNSAVANQRLSESNTQWKWTTDYNRRSIAGTEMYRVKQLLRGSVTLRDHDDQVMAMVRVLNKMMR